MANYQLNVKINGVEQAVSTVGQLEEALTATKEELKQIEIGSDAFNELTNQARNLQGELDRTFDRATNFNSSLTVVTESVTRLGSSIAAGFSLAISSFQLLGDESEELSEAQIKAQQALAIAFSATTIATNASTIATDVKIVSDRLSLGLTNLITAAAGKEAVAKAAAAAATGTATIAQRALNAAMSANPILLVVAALGALIGALTLFGDETKENITYQEDFRQELDRTTKAIDAEIKNQQKLIKLQGQIRENQATNEQDRLRIRLETQRELDKLDVRALENQKKNLETQLQESNRTLDLGLFRARYIYETQKTLQDRNIESTVDAETQAQVRIIRAFENGFITQQEYYNQLFALQEQRVKNRVFESEEERRAAQQEIEARKNLVAQITLLDQEIYGPNGLLEQQKAAEKLAQDEIRKSQREAYKKRKEQLEDYYDDVEKITEDRTKAILELERELEDFFLERISERSEVINVATGEIIKNYDQLSEAEKANLQVVVSNTEDIIAEYDERIAKLQTQRNREIADAQEAFEAEITAFKEAQQEKVKAGIISQQTLDDEIEKQVTAFNQEQIKRVETFTEQVTQIEQDKANKILEIDSILNNELAFGDNSLADSRASLALETIDFELQQSERRIEIERRYNVELIRERQQLEAQKRELLKQSLLAQAKIELEEALKNVQGTEEQKGRQREELVKRYNDRVGKINEDFRTQEEAAEKANADEINNYKIQKLQEYADVGFQILNAVLGFASALNELRQVETENALNELRDYTAQQTSILNESYNADLANLEARYAAGLITQEQYNQGVTNLQNNLDKSTEKLQQEQQKKELALKKKAFEDEKKLKIAQAIIAGLQGAVSAFAGAMTLGPIAGPIVGGILAAAVAATTAVQVAAIQKTKFDAGAPAITAANTPSTGGSLGGSNVGAQGISSGGGMTQFNPDLVGTPTGGTQQTGNEQAPGQQQQYQRVYVLEADITNTQQRVEVAESSATFG